MKYLSYLFIFAFLFFTGCSTKDEIIQENTQNQNRVWKTSNNQIIDNMQKVNFDEIEGFYDDNLDYALKVFRKDCQKSKKNPLFTKVCQKASYTNSGRDFFISNFQAYKLYNSDSTDEGLITGYYEPLLYGSYKKTARYKYPVYKIPKDLIIKNGKGVGKYKNGRVVPYDTREQIENNPRNPNYKVLAYVDDKIDLFFLQVQGSGKIKLNNGTIINVGYAGQNGREYTAVGKYMIQQGYLTKEEISAQTMKEFLVRNPSLIDRVLNLNDSYVFFKVSKQGATGSLNTLLTPQRNLAVDRSVITLGTPVFINTTNPISQKPINQLMVAADTGGAIKGEVRADFFWGFGQKAYEYAGKMKQRGTLYVLLPK